MNTILRQFSDVFAALGQNDDFTYPVENPNRRIDHILTKGGVEPLGAEVIDTDSSDHLPLIADLGIVQTPNGLNR